MNYTKKNFVLESNAIEGYTDLKLSSKLYKGHMNAYNYLLKELKTCELTEKMILQSHYLLLEGLIENKYAGSYRDCGVRVGDHIAPNFYQLPRLIELYVDNARNIKTEKDCWDNHFFYESIHPFIDGNGRSGRCLLNALLVKNGFKPVVIEADYRWDYYNKIIKWRDNNFQKIIYTNGAI